VAEDGLLPFGVDGGAKVSPSTLGEPLTSVAALESSDSPQFGQNLALSETPLLQPGHNMESRF